MWGKVCSGSSGEFGGGSSGIGSGSGSGNGGGSGEGEGEGEGVGGGAGNDGGGGGGGECRDHGNDLYGQWRKYIVLYEFIDYINS
jgi:hypothetical protein